MNRTPRVATIEIFLFDFTPHPSFLPGVFLQSMGLKKKYFKEMTAIQVSPRLLPFAYRNRRHGRSQIDFEKEEFPAAGSWHSLGNALSPNSNTEFEFLMIRTCFLNVLISEKSRKYDWKLQYNNYLYFDSNLLGSTAENRRNPWTFYLKQYWIDCRTCYYYLMKILRY